MIRVFPRHTKWTPSDDLAFYGPPPLFLPPKDLPVRISVVFTWDIPAGLALKKAWSAHYDDVEIGGPAFADPGGEFIPGRFIKEGVTITSRGCVRRCPWCFVPGREKGIRELKIADGWIVQDNNLLACSNRHINGVFDMLERVGKPAKFSGGLDIRLLKDCHRERIDRIRVEELWFASDTAASVKYLERSAEILDGIPPYKRRCYVMIGFNGETITEAERRLERVYELGFFPFCQLYQDEKKKVYPRKWQLLAKKWSRPAAYNRKKVSQ